MKPLLLLSPLIFLGCAHQEEKQHYIDTLESENNISYEEILNTKGAYIPPMCYSQTKNSKSTSVSNPCYSCHSKGKIPNYRNDAYLQLAYHFPKEMLKNPYSNFFKTKKDLSMLDDKSIMMYIRQSNYFTDAGEIELSKTLPKSWKGYRPDCYYNFDDEGFDHDREGKYTGWRAFRYYPFYGTFFPSNGNTDDVLIRLEKVFTLNRKHLFDKEVYKLNLAIVEAVVKQKEIAYPVDEKVYGVDVNADGTLGMAKYIAPDIKSYVGLAKVYLKEKKMALALGLFPKHTEFLHSVRYLDWDEKRGYIRMSARMKELRYAKKYDWKRYGEIKRATEAELWEAQTLDNNQPKFSFFQGNYEEGLRNKTGWVYQGFIEDKRGALRPQTHEETLSCMGCHSHLGATTDSSFSFVRKFEGINKTDTMYGWNHWSQKSLLGVKEPLVSFRNEGEQYAYSFYLQQNPSANAFDSNSELKKSFFDENGSMKAEMFRALHQDISVLLYPSKSRAIALNRAYKSLVEKQHYIYGKAIHLRNENIVHKEIKEGNLTEIKRAIIEKVKESGRTLF